MPSSKAMKDCHPRKIQTCYQSFRSSPPPQHVHVIGTIDGGTSVCPCCNRRQGDESHTLKDLPSASLMDLAEDEMSDDEISEEAGNTFGVLQSGVQHKINRVLAEGWLHKKGTGKDFFGSRGWKARYCRLALAKVDGFSVDVPLLLLYWFHYSERPSTIITLDSTVCMSFDGNDESVWDAHCFEIIYAKGDSKETTRTFTLPRKGRDAWGYAINQALYNYEKAKSHFECSAKSTVKKSKRFQTSPLNPRIWSGDKYMEVPVGKPHIPISVSPRSVGKRRVPIPVSPRSVERRPLPRSDALVGESFL